MLSNTQTKSAFFAVSKLLIISVLRGEGGRVHSLIELRSTKISLRTSGRAFGSSEPGIFQCHF
jgi:hypothetical protein